MTRKKVKLAFIENDSARKATYKKRKKGFMKKVSELSTLCGIDVCAIIYSPYESQPQVWPSPLGVQRVLAQFKKMPEMEQSKKMVNQETFLKQRISKVTEQLKKQQRDNREKEVTQFMYQLLAAGEGRLQNLNMMDLKDLGWLVDKTLKEIDNRAHGLKKNNVLSLSSQVNTGGGPVLNLQQQMSTSMFDPTATAEPMQKEEQQWLMNFGPDQGQDLMMPLVADNMNNNYGLWSNAFFPWDK